MNLLAIRLSAMGDVALTLPAIRSVLNKYPDLHITLLTRKQFVPFFQNIDRLQVYVADVKGKHKGVTGLYRLYKQLKNDQKIDAVIDLHDVLRSHILSFYFRIGRIPVFKIDKGHKEKKQLTAKKNKVFKPLKHTIQRYLDVFAKAGYPANLKEQTRWFNAMEGPDNFLQQYRLLPKSGVWIGIAPFSKHKEKMWPLEKMEKVIKTMHNKGGVIFLFGGGSEEINRFREIKEKFQDIIIVAGSLNLQEELELISRLDLMISMDSANMHLAWLSGIPVVSVWGATHPYAGFGPLNGNEKYIVQISPEKLDCRPCSVYGNKPCWRGDHACMEWIGPEEVIRMAEKILANSKSQIRNQLD